MRHKCLGLLLALLVLMVLPKLLNAQTPQQAGFQNQIALQQWSWLQTVLGTSGIAGLLGAILTYLAARRGQKRLEGSLADKVARGKDLGSAMTEALPDFRDRFLLELLKGESIGIIRDLGHFVTSDSFRDYLRSKIDDRRVIQKIKDAGHLVTEDALCVKVDGCLRTGGTFVTVASLEQYYVTEAKLRQELGDVRNEVQSKVWSSLLLGTHPEEVARKIAELKTQLKNQELG